MYVLRLWVAHYLLVGIATLDRMELMINQGTLLVFHFAMRVVGGCRLSSLRACRACRVAARVVARVRTGAKCHRTDRRCFERRSVYSRAQRTRTKCPARRTCRGTPRAERTSEGNGASETSMDDRASPRSAIASVMRKIARANGNLT